MVVPYGIREKCMLNLIILVVNAGYVQILRNVSIFMATVAVGMMLLVITFRALQYVLHLFLTVRDNCQLKLLVKAQFLSNKERQKLLL